jgi:hypothetical protein
MQRRKDVKMEPFDRSEHEGMIIELYYDEDCESPREWTNLGVMF